MGLLYILVNFLSVYSNHKVGNGNNNIANIIEITTLVIRRIVSN